MIATVFLQAALISAAIMPASGSRDHNARTDANILIAPPALHEGRPLLDPFRSGRKTVEPEQAQLTNSAPAPSTAKPPAPPLTCSSDDGCPEGTICDNGQCRAFERSTNVLLFRKEGPRTSFIPFYWSRTGTPGYRVVAPLYWHFWSTADHSQVVAPFYFRFEDRIKQKTVTVIFAGLPVSWSREPGASSWGVWPIIYRSTRFGWAAPLLGSFKIGDPDNQKSWGFNFFLHAWARDHKRNTAWDISPLVVSTRSRKSAFTWVAPLNFYWRNQDASHLLVLPFSYQQKDAKGEFLATWLGYHSREGRAMRGSVGWVYWYGRSPNDSKHDVLFPLVWSFRSKGSNTTVAGPFLHLRRPDWSFSTLFPIYYAGKNTKDASSFSLLIPLYFSRTKNAGKQSSWLTPLGKGTRDDDAGVRNISFWLPPMLFHRNPKASLDMVLGLYWRHRNHERQTDTMVAGPYVRSTDPTGSTTALLPLFWHFNDLRHKATATVLFPFYARRKNPSFTSTMAGVFPVWFFYTDRGVNGYSTGLMPLVFWGRDRDRKHAVVFPLFWHFADARSRSTVALPLYFKRQTLDAKGGEIERMAGIFPLLYFQGQDRRGGYKVQFPFFWRFRDFRTGETTTVVPPGFYRKHTDGYSAGVFPLLFVGRNDRAQTSHVVVAPLFWHFANRKEQRSTTVVLNYFYSKTPKQSVHAFFPIFHYSKAQNDNGEANTSVTLLPLFHYRKDATATVFASPVGAWSNTAKRQLGFVLPYFWYRDRNVSASVVPLLWLDVYQRKLAQRTRMFGPYIAVDAPELKARYLLPVFGRYETPTDTGTWIAPTYFRRRTRDGYQLDTFFPLFWKSSSPKTRTLQVGPWWSRTTDKGRSTGLIPAYLYTQNQQRSLLLTPLFYHRRDFREKTSKTWAALLFYRSTRPDGHRAVLFPLWFSGHEKHESHQVLFPLYWHFANTEQKTSTTVVGPFFKRREKSETATGLIPFFWYSRDATKDSGSYAFFPFFYRGYGRSESTFYTPLFGKGHTQTSTWWYVPPVLHRVTTQSRFTTVFPLWFAHENRETETKTRFLLPLLHFSRSTPEKSISSWLALFWRHRGIASASTVVFPLFFDHHSYYESRTTALLPLFLRYHRIADDTTYTIAPLFYRRADRKESTTVLFPLYWDFKKDNRRTSLLIPLYGRFERPDYVATFVFPSFYYRRGRGTAEGTYRAMLFPLWESAAKRKGDTMWEVVLGLFGYERIGRNRFVKVLFVPFEIEAVPRSQSAWYGRTEPIRRAMPARGFSGHIW
ncbi:MAG: hypothetical protein SGI86_04715 [Deltaproteobacteria bacterium]|nr:hypothetical protein [Deltaproteobacteria bacterium]